MELLEIGKSALPFCKITVLPTLTPPRYPIVWISARRLATCDALIAAAAECNLASTAALKNVFGNACTKWPHKPIANAAYGGFDGIRAIEYLSAIATALGIAPILISVNSHFVNYLAVAQGKEMMAFFPHLMTAVCAPMSGLDWWSRVFRDEWTKSELQLCAA